MATEWIYRMNVIIPVAENENKNALWTVIAPEGDSEALSFGVPLSADGQDPATHTAISTAATEEMKILIENIFTDELSDAIISVQDYRSNDWEQLLIDNGLQVIELEEVL